jgi:hypothetical protein
MILTFYQNQYIQLFSFVLILFLYLFCLIFFFFLLVWGVFFCSLFNRKKKFIEKLDPSVDYSNETEFPKNIYLAKQSTKNACATFGYYYYCVLFYFFYLFFSFFSGLIHSLVHLNNSLFSLFI